MIEMHSATEGRMFFIGLIVYIVISVLLTVILNYLINKRRERKSRKQIEKALKQKAEMTVYVSDDEYYEIAEKALQRQKMLEFKCEMNGIDKAIRVLKDDD